VPGSNGFMSCKVRPKPGHFTGDTETKRVGHTPSGPYLNKPYGWCSLTTPDETHYCSWYA
jgi:hypothetical protein